MLIEFEGHTVIKAVRRESGFTLQETLVAVNVGFLVVSFGLMLFLSTAKMLGSWQKESEVKNAVNMITGRVVLDSERSQFVTLEGDTLLIFFDRERMSRYRFTNGSIIRNDVPMNADNETAIDGIISVEPSEAGSKVINVSITGKSGEFEYRQAVSVKANPDSKTNFLRAIQ